MKKRRGIKLRQVIVPVALAVTVVAGAMAVTTSTTGCGDDEPRMDAGTGDGMPDTPII